MTSSDLPHGLIYDVTVAMHPVLFSKGGNWLLPAFAHTSSNHKNGVKKIVGGKCALTFLGFWTALVMNKSLLRARPLRALSTRGVSQKITKPLQNTQFKRNKANRPTVHTQNYKTPLQFPPVACVRKDVYVYMCVYTRAMQHKTTPQTKHAAKTPKWI